MTTGWELFGFPFLLNLFSFYPFLIVRFWKFIHLLTHCWCFSGVNCYWSFVMREVYYSFYLTKGPHPLKVTNSELILHSYSLEKKRVITFSWVFNNRTKSFSVVVTSRALCITMFYMECPGVRKDPDGVWMTPSGWANRLGIYHKFIGYFSGGLI